MRRFTALVLFGLLLTAGFARGEEEKKAEEAEDAEDYADEERAHLLVRKWIKEESAVQGRNVTVHLEVMNAGNSAASSVSIKDAEIPEGFKLLEGALTASYAKVDVGSKVGFSYVLAVTTAESFVQLEPAKVTYKADSDGEEQSTSSTVAYIEVLTPTQQLQRYALTGGQYVSLGMMRTPRDWLVGAVVFTLLAALFGGNSAYKSVTGARAASRRKAALASLEKDE